ncbi:MAG TPA: 16S rRNA (uracil(1498)-N(3))-methyltransferase [Nannocystis exedens]|nr:16S rRNA (uracil(1498)-N(3))-methyltransferase [Nannocystis exedens]
MNLLLLEAEDFVADDRAQVRGRRLQHVRTIHRASVGDTLRVGCLGGAVGVGRIIALRESLLELEVACTELPPQPLPVTLVFALPRPPTLKKVIEQGTAMGIKRFVAIGAARVERSYWTSKVLRPEALRERFILGLEQGKDTILPVFETWPRFSAFLRERWPQLRAEGRPLLADVGPRPHWPADIGTGTADLVLVVGPEGGFIDPEVFALRDRGAEMVSLGPRVLRVETAVVALLGHLISSASVEMPAV